MSEALKRNIERAARYLERFSSSPLPHRIGGSAVTPRSGSHFDNRTPVDDALLGRVAAGSAADVDAAANAAAAAFDAWRQTNGRERRAVLHGIADAIETRAEEIALIESMDTGQPIRFMAAAAKRGAENFRFFADKAPEADRGPPA